MIPGQDPQSAGEDLEALGHSELGGEVGHERVDRWAVEPAEPRALVAQIGVEIAGHTAQMCHEASVLRRQLEPRLLDHPQHMHGVVPCRLPEVTVQTAKELNCVMIPRPAKVVCEAAKSLERLGQ